MSDTPETSADQTINCRDCRTPFIFSVGEQTFYAERNFSTPVRCKPCRDIKKAQREGGGGFNAAPPQQSAYQAAAPAPDTYAKRPAGGGGGGGRKGGGKRRRDDWDEG